MRSLLIDSSGSTLFVPILKDAEIVSCRSVVDAQVVTDLHPAIRELLTEARCSLSHFDEIAVVRGPGNWTGVNFGVVTAKMFAVTLGTPITLLSRMQALIDGSPPEWSGGLALIPTGRIAFFVAPFSGSDSFPKSPIEVSRMTTDEVGQLWSDLSPQFAVTVVDDRRPVANLCLPGLISLEEVSHQTMITNMIRHLRDGSAVRLTGENVHLALPDYAGADKTIQTSAGSFR